LFANFETWDKKQFRARRPHAGDVRWSRWSPRRPRTARPSVPSRRQKPRPRFRTARMHRRSGIRRP